MPPVAAARPEFFVSAAQADGGAAIHAAEPTEQQRVKRQAARQPKAPQTVGLGIFGAALVDIELIGAHAAATRQRNQQIE